MMLKSKSVSNETESRQNKQWSGFIPVEDTKLFTKDTGGSGQAIIYLNGSYANQKHWKKVVKELGSNYRHILYDERARGNSKKSKDYSFDACLRDLTAIIEHRHIEKPILVGWSYGAILAVHWAKRYPKGASGIVAVDSAVPYGLTGDESKARIYKLFNRIKWILPFIAPFGLAARMTAKQHAEINIEINEISAKLEPILLTIGIPVRYLLASGASRGGEEHEFKAMRESLTPLLTKNLNLKVDVQVESNHEKILSKDYIAIANSIDKLANELNHLK
ncbi:alpha/beta fold hydrolase [Cesiribacter sp. SM1]|uniref:alpha/beta fold hydrolase n=1 Tax=Cesiribacter sp. SM1 TaxID=2861196 RepID=UPI001CD34548|nr:alpha/beta hydrolase [Cesiribacter sp. SM1]